MKFNLFTRSFSTALLFGFLFLVIGAEGYAQVSFKTVCPQKKIGKNDLLLIQYQLENAAGIESFTPPIFDQLSIVSGPNQEIGRFSHNGNLREYTTISYYLKPLASGTFVIPGAKAIVDGKEYKSNSISVEVSSINTSSSWQATTSLSIQPPSLISDKDAKATKNIAPENLDEKIKKNLFLRLQTDKKQCFVGEPITANFKLYTRLNSETTVTNVPSFNGFSMSELESDRSSSTETVNGKPYTVYTLRKVQLYPLQPGKFTVDPLVANNTVTFYNPSSVETATDLLNQLFPDINAESNSRIEKTVSLSTQPVQVEVKPLPGGAPASYKGAVGQFSIQAKVDKNTGTIDDAFVLEVTVKGKGNIQMINPPEIHWPSGFEAYDSKQIEDINQNTVPLEGTKTFQFPFTVNKTGNQQINSISFSFFDPSKEKYFTIKTAPIILNIQPSNGVITGNKTSGNALNFMPVALWVAGGMVFIGFVFWLGIRIKRKRELEKLNTQKKLDEIKNQQKEWDKIVATPDHSFDEVRRALRSGDSVYCIAVLHAKFKKYLCDRLSFSEMEWSKKMVNEQMDMHQVNVHTVIMVNEILDEIEMSRYAKSSPLLSLEALCDRTEQAISLLNKQVPKTYGVN